MTRIIYNILMLLIICGYSVGWNANSKTTIRVGWWGGKQRNEATLKVIELFKKKYPDIDVVAEYGTFSPAKFATQYIGEKSPDVMQVDFPWLYNFANEGTGFYDLYKLIDYGLDISGFNKSDLRQLIVNNKLMGLPFTINRKIIVLSKYYLDKYNFPIPKTWDDYKKLGMLLKEKEQGRVSIFLTPSFSAGAGGASGYFYDVIYPHTLQKYNKLPISKDKKILITEKELAGEIDFVSSLVKNNVYMTAAKAADLAMNDRSGINKYWLQGDIFTEFIFPATIPTTIVSSGVNTLENMLALPIPQIRAGETRGIYNRVAFQWGVNKDTKHPTEAAKFLNFYFMDEAAVKTMGFLRGLPINNISLKILGEAKMLSGIVYKASKMASELYTNEIPTPSFYEQADIRRAFDESIQRVLYGKITSKEAAKKIMLKLKMILRRI